MRFDLDKAFGIHPSGMLLRSKRAELLANNIANADTPNFKARDIDFKKAMQQALEPNGVGQLKTTHSKHIKTGGIEMGNLSTELLYRNPLQPSIDGNTMDSHLEKSEFTQNAIQYQASVNFVTGKIKSLLTAIKGE